MDFVKLDLLPIIMGVDPSEPVREVPTREGGEAVPERFRSGTVVSTPYEGGREVQADTIQCRHCGVTWVPKPGSGRRRGFCMRCNGYVCCRPYCERLGCTVGGQARIIENIERGLPINHVPITVSVSAAPPSGIVLG